MRSGARQPGSWLGLGLATACLAGMLVPPQAVEWLSLQPSALASGDLWRLWTGHFTHYSPRHALLNAATLLLLASLWGRGGAGRWAMAWLALALPLLSLGILAASPGLAEYRGASGLATLLLTGVLVLYWSRAPGIVAILGVLWGAKLSLEVAGVAMPWQTLPDTVKVSWPAHLLGMLLGLVPAMTSVWWAAHRYNPARP